MSTLLVGPGRPLPETMAGVEELRLLGAARVDLGALAAGGLKQLRLSCCAVDDLGPLEGSSIEELDLLFCAVEDLRPLLSMPSLRKLRVLGCPLDETSFERHLDALRARLRRGGAPLVESAPRDEWQRARRVWTGGLRLCVGTLPEVPLVAVQPGVAVDGRVDYAETFWSVFEPDLPRSIDAVYAKSYWDPNREPDEARFFCQYRTADADEAAGWIARAPLPADEVEALGRLARRFPDALFFQDRDERIDRYEQRCRVRVPDWLRRFRTAALGGLHPERPYLPVRLERGGWYELGLTGYQSEERRRVEEGRCHMLPIAHAVEAGESERTLAVRLDGTDPRVYEYDGAVLRDQIRFGQPPNATERVAFPSLAALLGSVVAFRDGDQPKEAIDA